jgi:hypothetical protein
MGSDGNNVEGKEESGMLVITTMGDPRSKEELVYAVGLNPLEEHITVIFQGSVTKANFVMDTKFALVRAPNPCRFYNVKSNIPGGDVGMHQGFHEYLMGKRDGRLSKYAAVVAIVERLLAETPTRRRYKLYIMGHSMGGGHCTIVWVLCVGIPHTSHAGHHC